ncbi:MAG: glycoside hydrolase family 3 C-terminal domain-containing protein [Clostridia bacterium]|nr:glycoside hydrolase family 3 C-terminal domain-containing protein [Clostridia bacterium]
MLKYNDIISKLSEAQKIRILSGVGNLSGKDMKILGIPSVRVGYMKDYAREKYPHAACLSHSWDPTLWQGVASAKLSEMLDDDVNLFITPGPRVKVSPYRKEMSEDSYLSYRMAATYASAVGNTGGVDLLSGYYLTEADVEWMDTHPNERVIDDQLISPYITALSTRSARALLTDTRTLPGEYSDIPGRMRIAAKESADFLVCAQATDENTVALINEGVICLSASSNAIEGAISRYNKIKQQIERGSADESRLQEEIRTNHALSPQTVDEALDKVLSFIYTCSESAGKARPEAVDTDALAYRSTLSSTVLLKNKWDLLPLSGDMRVAVIGDLTGEGTEPGGLLDKFRTALVSSGYECTGICAGYGGGDIHGVEAKNAAKKLLAESDAAILLLGVNRAGESEVAGGETLSLPAEQLRLANELARLGKPIVAVISDAYAADIDFTRQFDALLLAPLETTYGALATVNIISGVENPSGKLAYTLYGGADTAFAKRAFYKKEYGIKSGPFIGYKYYDTAELQIGYPFGYGLSYSEFEYSAPSIEDGRISFEVKNISDRKATEIVQIYIGMKKSAVIRPKKVLCSFARVELEPGQKKRIGCKIELPRVLVGSDRVVEGGEYDVYVCSSVSDVRLQTKMTVSGTKIAPDGERLIDYIQSKSNIKEDKFTLEADINVMKMSYKNILFGVSAIVLSVCLAVFNAVMELSSIFLGLMSVVLAIGAIIFFVMEANERNRKHEEDKRRIDQANKAHFAGAETVPNVNSSRLFHAEFDAQDKVSADEIAQAEEFVDEQIAEFIDSGFTLTAAVSEFIQFAAEKGYKFTRGAVENLLASMATSKLVITSMSDADFNSCILLLSEYFGTGAFVDEFEAKEDKKENDTFFASDANGDKVRKNILLALGAAAAAPEKIHISATKGVTCDGIYHLITPFARYISAQRDKNSIEIYNKVGANVGYTIAPNLWLFLNLASGQSVTALPMSISRLAALNTPVFTKGSKSDTHVNLHGLNRHQLSYITDRSRASDISEDLWKRFDKLERYAREYSDYRFGNKLWRSFEKHLSLLISCGAEIADAADVAMATHLLPSLAVVLNGNINKDDPGLLETVEFIFGSENIAVSREIIKTYLSDIKRKDAKADNAEA